MEKAQIVTRTNQTFNDVGGNYEYDGETVMIKKGNQTITLFETGWGLTEEKQKKVDEINKLLREL